jgi:hypothetical protein
MKIAFTDFWPFPQPFDPHNNFFLHALRACSDGIEVVDPKCCDVLFYGPFGSSHRNYRDCLKIYYTGENILPDYSECHASFTFSPDSYGGKNFRLPLWNLYIDWFDIGTYGAPEWLVPRDWVLTGGKSHFSSDSKHKFCAIVYGKPVKSRLEAIKEISSYRPVDVFGKANPGAPIDEGEWAKLEILSGYRFSLCYENSLSLGYHTEKLLHGKIAGGVPIYYGHESVSLDFNPHCCIQAAAYSPSELIERIRQVDSSEKLYRQIVNEPLFSKAPCPAQLCESVYRFILSQPKTQLICNRSIPYHSFRLVQGVRKGWSLSRSRLRQQFMHPRSQESGWP